MFYNNRKGVFMNKTKLYLSSEKSCIQICQLLFAEGYSVSRGKELKPGKTTKQFYIEYWKEN